MFRERNYTPKPNVMPKLVKPVFTSALDPQAALWIARLCIGVPATILLLNKGTYSDDMRQIIGLAPVDETFTKAAMRPLIKLRAEELAVSPARKTMLMRNVEMLGELLCLDALNQQILAFSAMAHQHPILEDFVGDIRSTSLDVTTKILAVALNTTVSAVRKALTPESPLFTSHIITVDNAHLHNNVRLKMAPSLVTALFANAANLNSLMRTFIEAAPAANLNESDFEHLSEETALLTAYLANTSSNANANVTGINILIYGKPGTGKTEYVRWLANALKKPLYQVRACDDTGNSVNGAERLTFFQLSQSFLKKSDALILFDEMEDVFPDNGSAFERMFGMRGRKPAGKLFINHLLESNPVPTLWVTNSTNSIDRAYLRRFDFSFEMNVPPIAVRRGILENYLQPHHISADTISQLSQQPELSPAQIEKAAKVLKLTATASTAKSNGNANTNVSEANEARLMLVIDNGMALLDQHKVDPTLNLAECSYQLDYLNADCELLPLIQQLKQTPDAIGALCFYGAPGTGKTALAHYIAHEMALPLMLRRASDIISPYVGETEQKIAAMFKQAEQDGALLLLDEADSFLTDRKLAQNSWEVTAVNEMLTQMESFKGLFICSTNLIEKLDAASLRRFALKIKFDYLKPEQRWLLFKVQIKSQSNAAEAISSQPMSFEDEYRAELRSLNNLTPGDFATVRRQAKLLNVTLTAAELLKRLKLECSAKSGGNANSMGFMQGK